ncbi:MAG: patatin-like phospholipase family protein, partial [Betaproteobacteria bacterium]|nr:patatin-like phospholipase family protein [Betaproteobacteria bacterium]
YEGLHESGIEPDWVVGTSIGAINGAIIAGNEPDQRMQRLREFWELMASGSSTSSYWHDFGNVLHNLGTITRGIPGFFKPNPRAWLGTQTTTDVAEAGFYSTAPLRETLHALVDFERIRRNVTRLTCGAVNVRTGHMRYFDSRDDVMGVEQVMASGALPPAFPAVMIEGEPYWDGGIYSNTPIEVVMDDNPRRNSVIFAAQLWAQEGPLPTSIQQVMGRHKDIQYASRTESHVARQQQIHHLRHLVRELGKLLPEKARTSPEVKEMLGWGCGTVMHLIHLRAPALKGEDSSKDIDFTPAGIAARWQAGREYALASVAKAPWQQAIDPVEGIVVHD